MEDSSKPQTYCAKDDRRWRWLELLSVLGSIASVTGISILWLKSLIPSANVIGGIPIALLVSTLFLGGSCILAYLTIQFYKMVSKKNPRLFNFGLLMLFAATFLLINLIVGMRVFKSTASVIQSIPAKYEDWLPNTRDQIKKEAEQAAP